MIYEPIPPRRCTSCHKVYPGLLEHFKFEPKTKLKLASRCRDCDLKHRRKHRHEKYWRNPDIERQKARERRKTNPEKVRGAYRKWRQANLKQARECTKRWERNHPEQTREADRRYYKKNRLKVREQQRKVTAANPGKSTKYVRQWREKNPERNRAQAHQRRAQKRELPNTFIDTDWAIALNWWNGICAYCGKPPRFWDNPPVLHQDHFIPQSKGGGYTPDNILPACQTCNLSKQDSDAAEWTAWKFGPRKGKAILKRIQDYLEWVKQQTP